MKHIEETTESIKAAVPAGFSVHEFAMAVARTLVDEYGEHNIERFINTLTSELSKTAVDSHGYSTATIEANTRKFLNK